MYFWGYGISGRDYQMVSEQQKKPPMARYDRCLCDMVIGNYFAADQGGAGNALL